jgi:hypothetical protein
MLCDPVSAEPPHTHTAQPLPRIETHPNWAGGDFVGQRLHGYDCRGADFRDKQLWCADLSGVDCSGGIFDDADLADTRCVGTNFSNASFVRTSLSGADVTNAILTGARITPQQLLRTNAWRRAAETVIGLDALHPMGDAHSRPTGIGPELTRAPMRPDTP